MSLLMKEMAWADFSGQTISIRYPPREIQTINKPGHIICMKPIYELVQETGLDIKPAYFTTLYLIEKHIGQKTVNLNEVLTLIFIVTQSNRGRSFKKVFRCIEEYLEINSIDMTVKH